MSSFGSGGPVHHGGDGDFSITDFVGFFDGNALFHRVLAAVVPSAFLCIVVGFTTWRCARSVPNNAWHTLEQPVATIRKRVGPQGTRFEAIIRLKRNGIEIHRESQTFDTRAEAKQWSDKTEDHLNNPAAAALAQALRNGAYPRLFNSLVHRQLQNHHTLGSHKADLA